MQAKTITWDPRWATLGCVLVVGLVAVLSGCMIGTPIDSVEVSRNIQYNDVPVPFGFEYDSDSWAYEEFKDEPVLLRSCEIIYWGDRPIKEVANWYAQQMPLEGWQLDRNDEQGDILMRFTKSHEFAEIHLKRSVNIKREGYVTRLTTRIGAI